MKKILMLLFLAMFFYGCPEPDKDILEHHVIHSISNITGHKVWVESRPGGDFGSAVIASFSYITNNEVVACPYNGSAIPWLKDSFLVIYDDTIKVWHTKQDSQLVSRSILKSENWDTVYWQGCEVSYTFDFTAEDYQEAFDNQ